MHTHHWQLVKEEPGIAKGTCGCGAVRFFVDDPSDKEKMERANLLNKKHGKEGIMTLNKPPAPEPLVKGLVPPRPLIPASAGLRERMKISYDYYESNKAPIIKEWEELGKPKTLKRWGIEQASLDGLLDRWGLRAKPEKKEPPHKRGGIEQFDKDKDAIIRDYQTMKLREFLRKWHISTVRWNKLQGRWKVPGKKPSIGIANRKQKAAKAQGQPKADTPVVSSELTEEEMAAICIKCEHLEYHNGKMHCAYEVCPLGYKLKTETGISTTRQPLSITKEAVRGTKAPQTETPTDLRLLIVPLPPLPAALPALPEFDSLWPSDVKMKWLDVLEKMAVRGGER